MDASEFVKCLWHIGHGRWIFDDGDGIPETAEREKFLELSDSMIARCYDLIAAGIIDSFTAVSGDNPHRWFDETMKQVDRLRQLRWQLHYVLEENPHDGLNADERSELQRLQQEVLDRADSLHIATIAPQAAATLPVTHQDSGEQLAITREELDSAKPLQGKQKSLSLCDQKAFSQYQDAVKNDPTIKTDDQAYDWLLRDKDGDIRLPQLATWKRMLRRARAFYGQSKNGSRICNETRSVVSSKRI
jgi:hypothetical protein